MKELNTEIITDEIQVYLDNGVSYIDALVEYSEKTGIEIELLGEIARRSPNLKYKIYEEAEKLNLVEKTSKLPF